MDNTAILAGLLRYALFGLGSYLASQGYLSADAVTSWQDAVEALVTGGLTFGPPAYYVVRTIIARRKLKREQAAKVIEAFEAGKQVAP
jgi:hypothetical protein